MSKSFLRILLFVGIVAILGSCNTYEKLLKSTDFELKYTEAKKFYNQGEYYKARTLFEELISYYKGSKSVEDLYYYYSWCYYGDKEYSSASYYFKRFAEVYPNSKNTELSQFMVAKSLYQLSPRSNLDQSNTIKAVDAFQLFVNNYPTSTMVPECNKLIDEMRAKLEVKALSNANLYYKIQDYKAAQLAYEQVLTDFPETNSREEINFNILKANFYLAENSVERKKEERYNETIATYYKFIDSYKQSKFIKDAERFFQISQNQISKINTEK